MSERQKWLTGAARSGPAVDETSDRRPRHGAKSRPSADARRLSASVDLLGKSIAVPSSEKPERRQSVAPLDRSV